MECSVSGFSGQFLLFYASSFEKKVGKHVGFSLCVRSSVRASVRASYCLEI